MTTPTVWHGTYEESIELLGAVSHNCSCEFGDGGVLLASCASHRMLTESQRILDGLLFARRMAGRLRREEFGAVQSTSGLSRRMYGSRRRKAA